eukprot:5218543-Pleurochrysis_carterae.AAC.1
MAFGSVKYHRGAFKYTCGLLAQYVISALSIFEVLKKVRAVAKEARADIATNTWKARLGTQLIHRYSGRRVAQRNVPSSRFAPTIEDNNIQAGVSVWETPVRCIATAVALRVAACQRGACFEA